MTEARRPDSRPKFAARLDDALHRYREKRVVKRGRVPGIIPYIGYGSSEWVRVLGRVLYVPFSPRTEEAPSDGATTLRPIASEVARVRGWRSFTSVHVPHYPVKVLIDGKPVAEVASGRGGVIDHVVPVQLSPGWHTITLVPNGALSEKAEATHAPVYIVDPDAQFGLLSDVDDTILNTALPRPLVAAWNSFVLDEHARTSTPGMPVLYDHLLDRNPGSPVIYLSTGAWNVAPALSRFIERNLYPMGSLLLTDWGPTTDRWFRSGKDHKTQELSRLVREFPRIKWVLVGDDGQHDEELYHRFATAHPQNVAAVLIRQLSVGQAVLAGGRSKARLNRSVSGVPWIYGPDGATMHQELRALGLL